MNGTGDGQIGAVYDHQVDFAIGCIYSWYFDVFDMTQSYAKSAVTLLVPAALYEHSFGEGCSEHLKNISVSLQTALLRIDSDITV